MMFGSRGDRPDIAFLIVIVFLVGMGLYQFGQSVLWAIKHVKVVW